MCLSVEWEWAKGICILELVPWTVLYRVLICAEGEGPSLDSGYCHGGNALLVSKDVLEGLVI